MMDFMAKLLTDKAERIQSTLLAELIREGYEFTRQEGEANKWSGTTKTVDGKVWFLFDTPGSFEGQTWFTGDTEPEGVMEWRSLGDL
jgi:hypothetical protein